MIVKVESKSKGNRSFYFDYAEPHPLFVVRGTKINKKRETYNTTPSGGEIKAPLFSLNKRF